MKSEEFDKLLRQVADEAQFPFEQERWEAAKAMLPQKKKRRWLPVILMGMGLTLLLFIASTLERPAETFSTQIEKNPSPIASNTSAVKRQESDLITSEVIGTNTREIKYVEPKLTSSLLSIDPIMVDKKISKASPSDAIHTNASIPIPRPNMLVNPLPSLWPLALGMPSELALEYNTPEPDKVSFYEKLVIDIRSGVGIALPSQAGGLLTSGLSIQNYFGNGLFISFNPNIAVSLNRGGNEKLYKRTIYGLEAHDTYYNIRSDYIFSLQMPLEIGLNHHWGRLAAGINSEYLLSALGHISRVAFQDDQWQSIAPGHDGKINNRHSERWRFGPVFSYLYPFNSRLEIGFEGGYWTSRFYERGDVLPRSTNGEFYLKAAFNYSIL